MVAAIIAALPAAPTGPKTGTTDPACWFGGAAATMLREIVAARIDHATQAAGRASNRGQEHERGVGVSLVHGCHQAERYE